MSMNAKMNFSVLCGYLFIYTVKSSYLPVPKCHLTDAACMLEAYQKAGPVFLNGIPEADVEVMDVMQLGNISFDLSGLQLSMRKSQVKGLKSIIMDNVQWDLIKKQFVIQFHVDCSLIGDYTAGGKLFGLPVSGDGDFKFDFKNLKLTFTVDHDIVKKGDKVHATVKKYQYVFDVKENAYFYLSNLFNGNKKLSEVMLNLLNTEWKEVTAQFGREIINPIAKKLFRNIEKYLRFVALSDIAYLD